MLVCSSVDFVLVVICGCILVRFLWVRSVCLVSGSPALPWLLFSFLLLRPDLCCDLSRPWGPSLAPTCCQYKCCSALQGDYFFLLLQSLLTVNFSECLFLSFANLLTPLLLCFRYRRVCCVPYVSLNPSVLTCIFNEHQQ